MILEPCKVGQLDFCQCVLIYTDLHGKCKQNSIEMHAKLTHFDQNLLVQLFTAAPKSLLTDIFMIFFEVLLILLIYNVSAAIPTEILHQISSIKTRG